MLETKNNIDHGTCSTDWKSRKPVAQDSEAITTRVGTMERQDKLGID